jgi:hypothetical protein
MVDSAEPYTVYAVIYDDSDETLLRGITQDMERAKKRIYAKLPDGLCSIKVIGTARTYRAAVALRGGRAAAAGQPQQSVGFSRRDGPVEVRFD